MVHACSGVRASKNFHTLLSVEYTCVHDYKRRCCCCHGHWSLPPLPPCVPPHQTFFSNSNFCLKKKNYAPPNTHYHLCKKKEPSQVFLATHTAHTSRLCPAAEMVLRSTMQYILYKHKTDFYIILSSTCTVSVIGHSAARRQPVCGLLGNEKYIPCM